MTTPDAALRAQVRALLTQAQAHLALEQVLDDYPTDRLNERVRYLPYSAYELLWHVRFTQRDILNFVRDGEYHEVAWPDGYWPHTQEATQADWDAQAQAYRDDLAALLAVLDDPQTDLHAVVPNGTDQTYLREFLVVADHTAYHTGELMLLRRWLEG